MVSLLRNYRCSKGEDAYIGMVHRLDQPVEGILVFAKNAESSGALSRQMAQGGFSKVYLAVTEGVMPAQEGKLEDYLKKDGRSNTSCVVSIEDPRAKRAELYYQVLETDALHTPVQNLVKIQLLTGRHHQIRVQMAHLGTPLAGDVKYGGNRNQDKKEMQDGIGKRGIGLCACALDFIHPVSKKKMKFEITPSQHVFQKFTVLDSSSKK